MKEKGKLFFSNLFYLNKIFLNVVLGGNVHCLEYAAGFFSSAKCFSRRQRFLLSKTYLLLFYVTVLSAKECAEIPDSQTGSAI